MLSGGGTVNEYARNLYCVNLSILFHLPANGTVPGHENGQSASFISAQCTFLISTNGNYVLSDF